MPVCTILRGSVLNEHILVGLSGVCTELKTTEPQIHSKVNMGGGKSSQISREREQGGMTNHLGK